MAVRVATTTRNNMMDALATDVDAGGGGFLRVYTGTQPANANTTASGTLLATIPLNLPAFTAAAASGALTLDTTDLSDTADNTGSAGWARLVDIGGDAILDGSVTETGGGGDFIISAVAITSGDTVSLVDTTITFPAS